MERGAIEVDEIQLRSPPRGWRACLSPIWLSFCLPVWGVATNLFDFLRSLTFGKGLEGGAPRVCSAGWGRLLQAQGTRAQAGEFQMTSPARRTLVPCCQTPHPSPLAQLWASLGTDVYKSLQCYNAEQGEFQQDEGCQVPPVLTVRSEKEPPPHAKTKNTTDTKIQAFRRNAREL